METFERVLTDHPFFHGMDEKYIQMIAEHSTQESFAGGEFIAHQGDPAPYFFLIRRGKVAMEATTPEKGSSIVQTLRDGEVLGWSLLFPPYNWQFDARAVELTRMIVIDADWLRNICEQDHDLGYQLMRRVAEINTRRLQATRLQLLDVYSLFS